MLISDSAVRHRTTVFVAVILASLAGLYSYYQMPRESSPDVKIPHIFVTTRYRGVSPEDMEKSVTIEIEKKLKGVDGVKKISSVSSEGLSSIDVEFVSGVDVDEAKRRVKDKVDESKVDLPTDLDDDPTIAEFNFSEMPILTVALSGNIDAKQLRLVGEDLQDAIECVTGVLQADISGGLEREIHVEVIPERLTLYGLSLAEVQKVVAGENSNVSGGSIRMEEGKCQLRVEGEFKNPAEAEAIVVGTRDGKPIYLRDLAKVIDGYKDRESVARVDGKEAVILQVRKRTGENILRIIDEVDKVIERSRKSWPPGLMTTKLMDNSKDIRLMVADLENTLATGFILVILVVTMAMGVRNAVLVSISIPLSMLLGFTVLHAMGVTLNMVVLFSLTLALGMLVDNAIVVVENIYRFMQAGVPRLEAAMRATSEVAMPNICMTMVTVAAFIPLLWWTGVMGKFMIFLPITTIIMLISCLLVALVVNPSTAAVFMHAPPVAKAITADELINQGEHPMLTGGGPIIRTYRRILRAALGLNLAEGGSGRRSWWPTLIPRASVMILAILTLIFCVQAWLLSAGLRTPQEFFPAIDPKDVYVNMEMPEGADIEYCDNLVKTVERRVFDGAPGYTCQESNLPFEELRKMKRHKDRKGAEIEGPSGLANIEHIFSTASLSTGGASAFQQNKPNNVSIQMFPIEERPTSSLESMEMIRKRVEGIAGAKITVENQKEGPPSGSDIEIQVSGDDFEVLGKQAELVEKMLENVPFIQNIRSDYQRGSPTIQVRVNRQRAALLGLSTDTVGAALRVAINGVEVSTYRQGDKDYDIIVRLSNADRRTTDTLRRIFIPSATSGLVPLTTVATIEYTGGLGQITRVNHNRVVTVKADVDKAKTTAITSREQAEAILAGNPQYIAGSIFRAGKSAKDFSARLKSISSGNAGSSFPSGAIAVLKDADLSSLQGAMGNSDETALAAALNNTMENLSIASVGKYWAEKLKAGAAADVDKELLIRIGKLHNAGDTSPEAQAKFKRAALDSFFPDILRVASPGFEPPPGYSYKFAGEFEFQQENESFLGWAFMMGLGLVFLVMVAEFNSVLNPFIIMVAVFLSLAGGFLGLAIGRMPFGVIMSFLGIISLAGVVANHCIVLIDYTQQLIERGMSRNEAIVAAGCTRLRPVFLTIVTAILGLVPLAIGISFDFHPETWGWVTVSDSSQWWKNMAMVVIFGLTLSICITLLVVPVVFTLLDDTRRWVFYTVRRLHTGYWRWFWNKTGIKPERDEPGYEE